MIWPLLVVLAASGPQFDITDARGKKPSGVTIEAGAPDVDGWMELKPGGKAKVPYLLVWPFDGRAKNPDGPGPMSVIVMERADPKALLNPKVTSALLAAQLLGKPFDAGVDAAALKQAAATLEKSEDYWAKGVGLLYNGKASDAVEPLGKALRERERVLTRIPSEIYPAAMLSGRALLEAGKFDEAALAFLKAVKLRPSERAPREARAQALVKAGKPEAAQAALDPALEKH